MPVMMWDPFRELLNLQERLDKMFRDVERVKPEEYPTSQWTPPVDIFESGDLFILKLEVPEVDKSTIDIKVQDNELTISGERKLDPGPSDALYHRMERGYGTFRRSFSLNRSLDFTKIKAIMKDGILRLELPKKEEIKPKQITIEG